MNQIEWKHCFVPSFDGPGPVIEIKDDCETYCATVPDGSSPIEMCQAFAATYDFNGERDSIACSWHTYRDGGDMWVEENGGMFRLEAYSQPTRDAHGFVEMC
jgi:hypothetical protein